MRFHYAVRRPLVQADSEKAGLVRSEMPRSRRRRLGTLALSCLSTFAAGVALPILLPACAPPDVNLLDYDGDGVPDHLDAFPTDPTESKDTDGDGVGDNADAFPEDSAEWADTDGDGFGDNADSDDDNDGWLDTNDAAPLDPNVH